MRALSTYTREQDAFLAKAHTDGHTAKVTAGLFATAFRSPLSRNAVIGRWRRLGLPPRLQVKPPPKLRSQRDRLVQVAKLATTKPGVAEPDICLARAPDAEGPPSRRLPIAKLTRLSCRWVSDTNPATFCGHPIVDPDAPGLRKSYCPHHYRLVVRP